MHTVHRYDRNDIMLGGCSTCGHGYCNGLVFQILIWAGLYLQRGYGMITRGNPREVRPHHLVKLVFALRGQRKKKEGWRDSPAPLS